MFCFCFDPNLAGQRCSGDSSTTKMTQMLKLRIKKMLVPVSATGNPGALFARTASSKVTNSVFSGITQIRIIDHFSE